MELRHSLTGRLVRRTWRQGRSEAERAPRLPRRRPAMRRRLSLVIAAVAALLLATGVFADSGTLDVEVAGRTGYAVDTTNAGAIVEYIGDQHTTFGAAGSGIFQAFLRVQANGSERGYNTDGTLQFDTKSGAFTHAILVSEIPVVRCESLDGSATTSGLCWELFADINETDSTKQISLDDLEIFFTANKNITGYPFSGPAPNIATKVYDFAGSIEINDVNQGSGRGDLRYLVPLQGIALPAECGYGDPDCTTYFVVYSRWGATGGSYVSDGGFEEWKVKRYPFLSLTKTAETTFTRTWNWTIDKAVTPATWNLFDGDSGTSEYTVSVTKTGFTDSDWAVSGSITIENPSDLDAVIESVTDEISGVGTVSVNCGVAFPYTLPDGETLTCTYSASLPNGENRTNTVTATLADGPVFTGSAAVTFGDPTTVVNDTINVSDTNGESWTFSGTDSVSYERTFSCDADEGSHENTATITETGQHDSASVTVTCYDLEVSKTAETTFTRTWNWTIDKAVTPASWNLFDGDSGTSEYTVSVTKTGFTDSDWAVSGSISVHNPAPVPATLTGVSDAISGVGSASVDCGVTFPYDLAAGGTLTCAYEADLPNGENRTNTATATLQNHSYASDGTSTASGTTDYSAEAPIDFGEAAITEVHASVSVTDTFGPTDYGPFSDDATITYSRTFDCQDVTFTEGHAQYTVGNTATITETGQHDSASVTVDCYQLTMGKDADESFDRTFEWTIGKSADQDLLTLAPDQAFLVNYSVTVGVSGATDDGFHVAGSVSIHNPNPDRAATLTGVSDAISGVGSASVDCGVTFPYDLAAGGTLTCTYEADLPNGENRTNTATATQQNYAYDSDSTPTASGTTDYSAEAPIDFGEAAITEIDECVAVGDTIAGSLGTVCVGEAPRTFTYSAYVGPYSEAECGDHDVPNTADFVTSDTGATGEASWNVHVVVPCPEGCTLTQGYWKTHSELGPAPEDPNWYLIGDVDGDGSSEGPNEEFFDTSLTWYEVFWTPVAGRPYFQLAHQWMAAYLNKLAIEDIGGSIPASVQQALDDGATLLDAHDGNTDIKGKDAKSIRAQFVAIASILAAFNEGDIGPGHCDEDGFSRLTAPSGGSMGFAPFGAIPLLLSILIRLRRRDET